MIISRLKQTFQLVKRTFSILKLMRYAQPRVFLGLILLNIMQGSLPLAIAWITKLIFDLLAKQISGNLSVLWPQLFRFLAAYAVFTLSNLLFPLVANYLKAELERQLQLTIQFRIYQKTNSFVGLTCFETPELHDTIRLANEGAQQGSNQTIWFLTSLVQSIVMLTGFLTVLLSFSFLLATLVILVALPQLYVQIKFGRQRVHLVYKISSNERYKHYYSVLLSSASAAKEMRMFNAGAYFLDKLLNLYCEIHSKQRNQQKRELRWEIGLGILSSFIATISFVLIIVSAFNGRLSLGDVTLFISAVLSVQNALRGSLLAVSGLHESSLFYTYYLDLMALTEPLFLAAAPKSVPELKQGIELRHVSFRYHDDQPWVLQGVNMTIPAGECVALVGLNGAGKTTLVKLLLRFYDPTEGQILWDGVDICQFDPAALRQRMGAIFQDFMRYDLTVQENIGIGDVAHIESEERVQQAAERSGVHEMIANLPQRYHTELTLMFANGNSPLDLSGGQWQKIATARLFMRQDADLLILDEPTAALDAEAEHELYEHFATLVEGHTSLLISHRFSTVRMADRIVVLEGGQISEQGTHETLLRLGGQYAKLYGMQAEKYRG